MVTSADIHMISAAKEHPKETKEKALWATVPKVKVESPQQKTKEKERANSQEEKREKERKESPKEDYILPKNV